MFLRLKILIFVFLLGLAYVWDLTPNVGEIADGKVVIQRLDSKSGNLVDIEVGPKTPNWTPIRKVSRFFLNAIVVAEDSRFYQHDGLDFREIWNSFQQNLEEGRYARGASTITQQVVRIVFLTREKTILRKFREALGALYLEWTLSKEEILEWYVNLIPLGLDNYGVRQASLFFFNTDPVLLSITQSVLIAMIVPAPSIWTPGLLRKRLSLAGQKRFAKILNALYSEGYVTSAQVKMALASGNFGDPIVQ